MTDETGAFIAWLARRFESCRPETLRTLYTIAGGADVTERTLDHLEGYRGSRPVRIGNAAADQLQLDIYGELLDAIYLYDKYKEPTSYELWGRIAALVDWVADNWRLPDDGIWEVRSGRREFLYSRILCWVAIDRGIRMAVKRSFPAPLDPVARSARRDLPGGARGLLGSEDRGVCAGSRAPTRLDAACLIMPLVRFISPTDPRWLSTLRAVEARLVQDSLVYRYEIEGVETDGLEGAEGSFSHLLLLVHRVPLPLRRPPKARFLFEKMLGYANHVGLYAEEIGPRESTGELPAGVHPPGADQRGVRSRPEAVGGGVHVMRCAAGMPKATA